MATKEKAKTKAISRRFSATMSEYDASKIIGLAKDEDITLSQITKRLIRFGLRYQANLAKELNERLGS